MYISNHCNTLDKTNSSLNNFIRFKVDDTFNFIIALGTRKMFRTQMTNCTMRYRQCYCNERRPSPLICLHLLFCMNYWPLTDYWFSVHCSSCQLWYYRIYQNKWKRTIGTKLYEQFVEDYIDYSLIPQTTSIMSIQRDHTTDGIPYLNHMTRWIFR